MSVVAGDRAIPVPDVPSTVGDGDVGFEALQRAAPARELASSQHLRDPSDQAMAKGGAATALVTFDDDPTIEEWMVPGEKPGPEIADFCTSERTEVRGNDRAVVQLAWGKRGCHRILLSLSGSLTPCCPRRAAATKPGDICPRARPPAAAGRHLERDHAGDRKEDEAALKTTGFHKAPLVNGWIAAS